MSCTRSLGDPSKVKGLAVRLSTCPEITRLDDDQDKEGWTIALALSDLEAAFAKIVDDLLPRLVQAKPAQRSEMVGILLDIGEEFRHVLQHIRDPKFYQYLSDADGSGQGWSTSRE